MKNISMESKGKRGTCFVTKGLTIGTKVLLFFSFLIFIGVCDTEKALASSAEPLTILEEDEISAFNAGEIYELDTVDNDSKVAQCQAMKGVWDGVYYNSDGVMSLQLFIDDILLDGSVTARFSFCEHPDNPGTPSGSYTMKGNYNFDNNALSLNGDAWIDRPGSWTFLSINANVDLENRKMTGSTGSYSGLELVKTKDDEWKDYSSIEQCKVLLGVWEGYYFANQGKTALKLSIQNITIDGKVDARFDFSEHPDNPGVPTGSYTMKGTYDFAGHNLQLDGVEWIEHPATYYILSVNGKINTGARTMSGSTGGYSGLTLSKSGSDRDIFTIEAQAYDGGTIKPEVGVFAQEGASQSFEIYPDKGFIISYVIVDGNIGACHF